MTITTRQTLKFVLAMVALIAIAQAANAKTDRLQLSDRTLMKDARLAFEKKDYKKALSLYEEVPQASDYWAEALEERAWSHLHLKEHDRALALVKTLQAPPMNAEIGGEPYLLTTLIHLRLCNYNELFKTMKRFKSDIQPRHTAMKELAKTGETEETQKMINRSLDAKAMTRVTAGGDLTKLPRLFYRDAKIQEAFQAMLKPGASDRFPRIIALRMKALAERDAKETEDILRKLHLVEVESVSRIYAVQHLADAKKAPEKIKRDAETLVFPDDDGDIWLDELDSYHVNAKGCPGAVQTPSLAKGQKP
ncbi:MAG: hypothetical protein RBT63_04260 [Bdellovibrionales bacterium]|jgi:tetratricopeptide (TPR) repeat protein|nr:hypothetical protein [Bdellovibrionales bacterium]